MSRLRSPSFALALCALLTAATGCSSDDKPDAAESSSTTIVAVVDPSSTSSIGLSVAGGESTTSATTSATVIPAAQPSEPSDAEKFPLDATFGIDANSQPDLLAQSETERLTAECMVAAGWKYTPTVTRAADDPTEFTEAYGERYGYGIVHLYVVGRAAAQAPADANERYVASLTDAEKKQYYDALFGDQTNGYDPTKGCANTAETAVKGPNPFQKNPEFAARVQAWLETFDQNPAIAAAVATRTACMLAHFPTIDRYDSASEYVQELFSSAYDGSGGQIPADQLDVLATTELEVWRTERDCAESSGYNAARRQVEAEFVTELLAEFPELAVPAG